MKTSENSSPFAALTSQEQKERWICWQCARESQRRVAEPEPVPERMPELRLPQAPAPASAPPRQRPHHSQYDAVMRRMKDARLKAQEDQRWTL